MKLYYYKGNNFGDKLNPLIWDTMAAGLINGDESTLLVGIGTLINSVVPSAPQKVVFGSGAGYMQAAAIDDKWKFYCVRGPRTAQVLGLDKKLAITDPALLLNQIVTSPVTRGAEVCFMPHHLSADHADWRAVCAKAGITYLDPGDDIDTVIASIRGAKLVIAEAMHAAIVADAFRVPWVPVQIYDHILGFKWQDWCDSMQLPYRPETVPSLWDTDRHLTAEEKMKAWIKRSLRGVGVWSDQWTRPLPAPNLHRAEATVVKILQRLATGEQAYLSDEKVQATALARLLERLDRMKRDFAELPVAAPACNTLHRHPSPREAMPSVLRAGACGAAGA